ncbi:hypothetical protein [Bradyrhizobium sp. AZCC 2176]|uniref:hypothetical protein n=1 Tax=Bradyrhizobium sp. AZCC 2176 TaxID=3117025 RepID=UPI002FEE9B49
MLLPISWPPSRKRWRPVISRRVEAGEIGKLIDVYVKAYQTAELDDRIARVEQLSDAELMHIAAGGLTDAVSTQRPQKLMLLNSR